MCGRLFFKNLKGTKPPLNSRAQVTYRLAVVISWPFGSHRKFSFIPFDALDTLGEDDINDIEHELPRD